MARFKKPVVSGFFVVLAILGGGIVGFAVDDFRTALVSATWPTVNATAMGDSREGLSGMMGRRYVYSVGGRNFEGRQVRFFVNNRLLNPAPPKAYSTAQQFPIHVHPDDPARAVIITGASGFGFMIMLMSGAMIFFVGLGGAIRAVMQRPSGSHPSG